MKTEINMSKWDGGKGSKRRPENDTTYQDNWEKIFGVKKPETKVRKKTPSHAKTKYDRKKLDNTENGSIIDI
jgi:hypothetical protein